MLILAWIILVKLALKLGLKGKVSLNANFSLDHPGKVSTKIGFKREGVAESVLGISGSAGPFVG
jgi:hypothetical protein